MVRTIPQDKVGRLNPNSLDEVEYLVGVEILDEEKYAWLMSAANADRIVARIHEKAGPVKVETKIHPSNKYNANRTYSTFYVEIIVEGVQWFVC